MVLAVGVFAMVGCVSRNTGTSPEQRIAAITKEVSTILLEEHARANFEARLMKMGARTEKWSIAAAEPGEIALVVPLWETAHSGEYLIVRFRVDQDGQIVSPTSEKTSVFVD